MKPVPKLDVDEEEEEVVTPVEAPAPAAAISPATVTTSLSVLEYLAGPNNKTMLGRALVIGGLVAIIVLVELIPASDGVLKQTMQALLHRNNDTH
jgi:hypothetical protein